MPVFKNYDYSENEVTAQVVDTTSGDFLWIAYASDGTNCNLKKVSAHDPSIVYFDIDVPVSSINMMAEIGNYIYLAVTDTTYYMYRVHKFNPISSCVGYARPSGVTESPVDVVIYSSAVYFLFPGTASGENAKIVHTDSSGTFVETIDLQDSGNEVLTAHRLTVASGGDLYVFTYTDPIQVWRVYQISGGLWVISENQIT